MPRRFGISAREAKPRQLARHGSLHLHFPHLVRLVLGIHEHGLCARLVLAPQVASLALLEKSQVPDLRRIRDLVVVLLGGKYKRDLVKYKSDLVKYKRDLVKYKSDLVKDKSDLVKYKRTW